MLQWLKICWEYLKTALYPDGNEKVNTTLKMQMKKQDVIYPSRTCLGGEKETEWRDQDIITPF